VSARGFAVAGCLWAVSAVLVLPGVWVGIAYRYTSAEWLSLLQYPAESTELFPWLVRIILTVVLIGSTLFILAHALRWGSRATNKPK